jgi:hypothetical protein
MVNWMTTEKLSKKEVFENTKRLLDTAELGYKTLTEGSPKSRLAGLMNVVVFGRAVTNALQKLRGIEPEFDKWYSKYVGEMTQDSLLKFFYNLRSEILKEGVLSVGNYAQIKSFNFPADMSRIPPPPPYVKVKGFFIGDRLGGSGYKIIFPDGYEDNYYVDIPRDLAEVKLVFHNTPKMHLGQNVSNLPVDSLSRKYLDYIQSLVKDADNFFNKK